MGQMVGSVMAQVLLGHEGLQGWWRQGKEGLLSSTRTLLQCVSNPSLKVFPRGFKTLFSFKSVFSSVMHCSCCSFHNVIVLVTDGIFYKVFCL